MAILKQPMFSDEARRTVAGVAVFRRAAVHPQFGGWLPHPIRRTPAKIQRENQWKTLCSQWQALPDSTKTTWRTLAPGVLTGFNYFIQLHGVLPVPEEYTPPAGDNIQFNFTATGYSPPTGDALAFNF